MRFNLIFVEIRAAKPDEKRTLRSEQAASAFCTLDTQVDIQILAAK